MGGVDPGMEETLDLLDTLLDGVSEPRLKLISADEGRPLMVLLGLLDDAELPEDIRRAAVLAEPEQSGDPDQRLLPTGPRRGDPASEIGYRKRFKREVEAARTVSGTWTPAILGSPSPLRARRRTSPYVQVAGWCPSSSSTSHTAQRPELLLRDRVLPTRHELHLAAVSSRLSSRSARPYPDLWSDRQRIRFCRQGQPVRRVTFRR
ncbi:hypothetical protein ACIA98_38280 [Streptomyces sp. NPDC051366]|uniref:hypothetical protein n=1 Tax=Streptomyces sp. NPDC051366 TaxID=3365652 RepID=UPI00378FBC73